MVSHYLRSSLRALQECKPDLTSRRNARRVPLSDVGRRVSVGLMPHKGKEAVEYG